MEIPPGWIRCSAGKNSPGNASSSGTMTIIWRPARRAACIATCWPGLSARTDRRIRHILRRIDDLAGARGPRQRRRNGDRNRIYSGEGGQGAQQHRRGGAGRLRGDPRLETPWRRSAAASTRRWISRRAMDFPSMRGPCCSLSRRKRCGAIVLNHNALAMKGDHAEYIAYLRDPANGFVSSSITLAGELSVWVAP